jgi:hypothetical protein
MQEQLYRFTLASAFYSFRLGLFYLLPIMEVIKLHHKLSIVKIKINKILISVQEKSIYYDTECEQNPGPDDCKVNIKLDEDFTVRPFPTNP